MLIVDNGTDHAARDAFRAANTIPGNARWLDSFPPGLSRARNFALETARTPLVAFIDDDAIPVPEWAEELLRNFRAHPEDAIVAGPIEADWRGMTRPAWLPARYEACLAILDLGSEDRALAPLEYGFGANLALRRDPARAVGGFDETLGRKGGATLLSNEEIVIQVRLRAAGHTARYAAGARVRHRMRAERLSRNWLRARMAWQVVSESLQQVDGWPWLDWCRQELRRAATALGIEETFGMLLAARDGEAFADQLNVITNLLRILLAVAKEPEGHLEALFPPPVEPAQALKSEPLSDVYRPAAAMRYTTEYVFADFRYSHSYLGDLYSDHPASAFVQLPGRVWYDDPHAAIAYLEASITPCVRAIFLLTLDPFSLTASGAAALVEGIARWRIPTIAIQHRLPETVEQRQMLAGVVKHLHCVVGLSDAMASRLKGHCCLTNVAMLRLHPSMFRYVMPGQAERTRTTMGAGPGHVVFGIIGDAREGKGIGLMLAALDHLATPVREAIFFLIAGRACDVDPDAIIDRFATQRIAARVDLRGCDDDPTNYVALTRGEYADAIAATDFGLLLYQGPQRDLVSGALPDFVWQRKRILATRSSFVGAEVARHGLGLTLDAETPEALATLITEAVVLQQAGTGLDPGYEAYRSAISPTSTLSALAALLDSTPKMQR